jgi:Fe2+ transport system protein FeoA
VQAGQVFPLSQAPIGAPLEVVQILSTGGVEQRLRPMGLAPGDPVRVVRGAPFWGPIVVEIPGRVIALGRGVARHVLVRTALSTPAHPATGPDDGSAGPPAGGR